MSAAAFFWAGLVMVVVSIFGLALALCRAAALGDEINRSVSSDETDAPCAPYLSSRAHGATSSRKRGDA